MLATFPRFFGVAWNKFDGDVLFTLNWPKIHVVKLEIREDLFVWHLCVCVFADVQVYNDVRQLEYV